MFVVRRKAENPILSPRREYPWEALATFNPSAVRTKDGVRLYYRAEANPAALLAPFAGQSSIGIAASADGTHFNSREQVITATEDYEAFGCEDPRATFFEGKWYIFYTALGGIPFGPDNIKVAVAIGDTPEQLTEKHLVTPFNAKAAALFPERVSGEAVLMLTAHTDFTEAHPRPTIAFARSKNIEDFWSPDFWNQWHEHLSEHALPELRREEDDHIEVGATPILTDKGWLLIYSYIQHYYDESKRLFGVEAALLDRNDPQTLLSRTYPFMVPEEFYERYGLIPNIVFPTSALVHDDGMLDIYYGAADTTCAMASVRLADLLFVLAGDKKTQVLTRAQENPILVPSSQRFESLATLNAASVDIDGSIYLLYRAMGEEHTSTIGLARSSDGIHIDERLTEPCYSPRADFEQKHNGPNGNSGCEDPRAVVVGDTLYMTYTAYDGVKPPRGAVSSIKVSDFLAKRFDTWTAPALVTPDGVDDKDVGLSPLAIDGNFVLYHRISNRICADLVADLSFGKRVSRCIEIMGPREGMWDSVKVGIAGPPHKVPGGWLLIYHGVSAKSHYRLGAVLLDESGLVVLARTADPIFEATEPYEIAGEVGNVVFSCGSVIRGDTLFVYYGGGDRVLGVATGQVSRILKALTV